MRSVHTSMKVLVKAFVRWSWLLVLCVVAGAIIGNILSTVIQPTYQSSATVQLSAPRMSQFQIIQPISYYIPNVNSDAVVKPVLQKYPNVDLQTFRTKELIVTPIPGTQSFQIQVTLSNSQLAAAIANDLAQLLVKQQNAYIKSQYDTYVQSARDQVAKDDQAIAELNKQATTAQNQQGLMMQMNGQMSARTSHEDTLDAATREQQLYGTTPFSIVTLATPMAKPTSIISSIPLTPVMASFFLVFGVVAASFFEQSVGRINTAYALQQKISAPVVGALRWKKPMMSLRKLCEEKTQYTEDCRVMMADVLFHAEEHKARIIALTSIRSGAGTSTIAAQLAALLAQSKRRVLLIDANLYQPRLHELVGIPNTAGLASMLEEARKVKMNTLAGILPATMDITQKVPAATFIKATPIPNLYMLPAGNTRINPVDLVSMSEMGQFLKWASQPIDFIIIDCPALDRGDIHVISALCHQTLVVVDAAHDRMKQVVNTKEELAHTGVKLSGVIVNKLEK